MNSPPTPAPTAEQFSPLPDSAERLQRLAQQIEADFQTLRHPEKQWVPPQTGPNGEHVYDVIVAGAGQAGLAIGGYLLREGVDNILLIDKAAQGKEGVWFDFARMPLIRSPKHYPGPDQGMPNLSYEAWHLARYGKASWETFELVPVPLWTDYLDWIRAVTRVPVQNQTRLTTIAPHPNGLAVSVETPDGNQTMIARRLVLATGHDGTGKWWMPDYLEALPAHVRAQAAQPIDFSRLAGKTVAVLGIGASAGDNAIAALRAGASAAHMFCRRDTHRRQQVYRWVMSAGFLRHCHELDDEWRWRFVSYILETRMAMPTETWRRLSATPGFELHTSANWRGAKMVGDQVEIDTEKGPFRADFIISATGHDQDLSARQELAPFADKVSLWSDAYQPPPEERNDRLSRYPYLDAGFSFTEKNPGEAPWISRIHDFTFGPTMSFGPSGCSISTLRLTVPMVVAGVTKQLFKEDVALHWQGLRDYPDYIP